MDHTRKDNASDLQQRVDVDGKNIVDFIRGRVNKVAGERVGPSDIVDYHPMSARQQAIEYHRLTKNTDVEALKSRLKARPLSDVIDFREVHGHSAGLHLLA